MKYVALLRGINVGGKNKIAMKQLAEALGKSGLAGVSTYINSGNIFFTDNHDSIPNLQKKIETVIEQAFELQIKVLVINKPAIDKIVSTIPPDWTNDTNMKCDVMFLWDTYKANEVIKELPLKTGVDTAFHTDRAIIWGVPRNLVNKSGMTKIIGTEVYAHMTLRNCNTVRKIQQIMTEKL